jgi:4'-phosphopantetheinyl transferase
MLWQPRSPLPATVDLYYANLDARSWDGTVLAVSLSEAEWARATRFRFERDRRRFVAGRAVLRHLLAALADCSPADLDISTGYAGKPETECGPAFNVSHSGGHLLIGLAAGGQLGVDIERKISMADMLELARGHFSIPEIATLESLPREERSAAFLRIWTRKEALLKALGAGLSMQLESVTMNDAVGCGNCLSSTSLDSVDPAGWCVKSVAVADGLEAAVAWDRPHFYLSLVGIAVEARHI